MIVYGASGHGKVIIEILESAGVADIAVWDDADKAPICSYTVQKPVAQPIDKMIIAIGVNATRKRVVERIDSAAAFGTAVHAFSQISKRAAIGEGTVVMAGVVVNADTKVGRHCILNTSSSIDHDCVLGDYVHISPNATLCGDVQVGEGTHIGAGATVIQGVRIGRWCTIGAGAVVIKDIPDHATAVGNPAKVIKVKEPQHER
jgi:acetyltransferase EpsM